jgi:hypothetical protein
LQAFSTSMDAVCKPRPSIESEAETHRARVECSLKDMQLPDRVSRRTSGLYRVETVGLSAGERLACNFLYVVN